jgi:hypothetical protein
MFCPRVSTRKTDAVFTQAGRGHGRRVNWARFGAFIAGFPSALLAQDGLPGDEKTVCLARVDAASR